MEISFATTEVLLVAVGMQLVHVVGKQEQVAELRLGFKAKLTHTK